MIIDEVIENLKYDIEIDMYIHDIAPQIAKWLEELKAYREIGTVEGYKSAIECYTEEYLLRKSNKQYNKALDDLSNTLKENYDYLPQIFSQEAFGRYIDEYAEQLKAGVKNEQKSFKGM